ncbi:MAG: NusG domain II-containing protein [Sphaerochaetaceae bacterium]
MRMKTFVADGIAILISLGVIFMMAHTHTAKSGAYLNIQSAEGTYRYPLSEDRTILVDGPLGKTTVVIKDGKASITDSPCESKACTRMAPISDSNGFVACLPNGVLLTVVSDDANEVDDVTN